MRGAGWVRRLRKPYSRRPGLRPVIGRAPSPGGPVHFPGLGFAQFALLSQFDYVAKYILFLFYLA